MRLVNIPTRLEQAGWSKEERRLCIWSDLRLHSKEPMEIQSQASSLLPILNSNVASLILSTLQNLQEDHLILAIYSSSVLSALRYRFMMSQIVNAYINT